MNSFPRDFENPPLTGFGGDPSMNRAQHRAAIKHTPVILVHGNAANSVNPKFGMLQMKEFLKDQRGPNYQDCEIWAMDYLGENKSTPDLQSGVHRRHIENFRKFIDRVRDYLGVKKLDIIAHSLGCTMTEGYLRGLQSDGKWKNDQGRFDSLSTLVCLAGGLHGLGNPTIIDEFTTGGDFEKKSHDFNDVTDETPFGSNNVSKQISPVEEWKQVTSLDNNSIRYVALTAVEDFVDHQKKDTGHLVGADLNKRYDLGLGLPGHEAIIKTLTVFNDFKPYLNQNPPRPPVTVTVDKASGNHESKLRVTIAVDPANMPVNYTAKRLTKAFNSGFIMETVAATDSGTLSNGQSLTLSTDGAWDVVFSADGMEDIVRTYGVNVHIPEVTILTDNSVPFKGSLNVMASTNKGTIFFSLDGQHWNARANAPISQTSTVFFIAIDADGLPSPIVSRSYEKEPVISATGTLTEHFVVKRLTVSRYLELGRIVGFTAVITLYFINDQWVLDPDTPQVGVRAPIPTVSVDSGVFTKPVTLALMARHETDPTPKIHYTLDGSMPTEHSPAFVSSGLLKLDTSGTKTIKFRAVDAFGKWSDVETKTYTMNIKEERPKIVADRPNGEYSEAFDTVISASNDVDKTVTVYYTLDGSDPSVTGNPNRDSFLNSITFEIEGSGNHSVFCYAKDSAGNETFESFAWCIDDQSYPETAISPAMGGTYVGGVDVVLSPSERCQWTKYTIDNSEPSGVNGIEYGGPITITETTRLKFRSKDVQGNVEPVKAATFTIVREPQEMIFDNNPEKDGHVRAKADGSDAFVGSFSNLAIGQGRDGKESRAILHFDTSSLPDNVYITSACLEVKLHSKTGDIWADGRKIKIDVQQGYFGSSQAIQAEDWGIPATTEGIAHFDGFASGTKRSTNFSPEGMHAINKTGATQIRLRVDPPHTSPSNCIFITGGAEAKLIVKYSGG